VPHLHVEYSPGLEPLMPDLCRALHGAMAAQPIFPLAGIRVRAFRSDHAIIADAHPDNDFAALTLSVGAGRSTAQLQDAGRALFDAARDVLAPRLAKPHLALSLEIRVIDPELGWKETPIHARLSGQG